MTLHLTGGHHGISIPQSPVLPGQHGQHGGPPGPMVGADGRPLFPPGMPMVGQMQRPPSRDLPPGSGMSELQKLVNMQPHGMLPEDSRVGPESMFGCPPPGIGASGPSMPMSPRQQIPAAQPLPPHLGPPVGQGEELMRDGHTPDGLLRGSLPDDGKSQYVIIYIV